MTCRYKPKHRSPVIKATGKPRDSRSVSEIMIHLYKPQEETFSDSAGLQCVHQCVVSAKAVSCDYFHVFFLFCKKVEKRNRLSGHPPPELS